MPYGLPNCAIESNGYNSIRENLLHELFDDVSPVRILRRAFARVINIECVPTFDKYDHITNMKTKDIFQFEPFHDTDLLVLIFR